MLKKQAGTVINAPRHTGKAWQNCTARAPRSVCVFFVCLLLVFFPPPRSVQFGA